MLQAGQSNHVTFKVNVMGTQLAPTVRVVIAATPDLSFPATYTEEGWSADLNIPSNVASGSYDLRVEVLLNNRLFTPLHKKVEITGVETAPNEIVSQPKTEEPPSVSTSMTYDPMRDTDSTPDHSMPPVEKLTAAPPPPVVHKFPDIRPKPTTEGTRSLFADVVKSVQSPRPFRESKVVQKRKPSSALKPMEPLVLPPIDLPPAPQMEALTTIVQKPVRKLPARAPKIVLTNEPIRVTIAEVAQEAKKIDRSASSVSSAKPKVVPIIETTVPVRLTKGEIIYE